MLPTLKASRELKNWYFTMKFLQQNHLYDNNTCTKFQGQKFYQKKDIQNLLTCVVVKCFSLLPTLTASQRLNYLFFAMKFLKWDHLYVDNMCAKFQAQNIYSKKDIRNLPTCVVMKKIFTTANFDTFSRAEKLFFFHQIFGMSLFLNW